MIRCPHTEILLLPPRPGRLRCRHCHLTLSAEELAGGCCPECLATDGSRRCDFDEMPGEENDTPRYRCETCGAILHPAG